MLHCEEDNSVKVMFVTATQFCGLSAVLLTHLMWYNLLRGYQCTDNVAVKIGENRGIMDRKPCIRVHNGYSII